MNNPMYNPYAHASELGIEVKHVKFSGKIIGYYDHEIRTIYISSTLSLVYAACVLAHELVHAVYEDSAELMQDPVYRKQAEKRCDELAAKNLMPETKLIDILKRYESPETWYETMCIMPWVLKNYLANLNPTQRAHLESLTGRDLSPDRIDATRSWEIAEDGRLVEVDEAPHQLTPEENGAPCPIEDASKNKAQET